MKPNKIKKQICEDCNDLFEYFNYQKLRIRFSNKIDPYVATLVDICKLSYIYFQYSILCWFGGLSQIETSNQRYLRKWIFSFQIIWCRLLKGVFIFDASFTIAVFLSLFDAHVDGDSRDWRKQLLHSRCVERLHMVKVLILEIRARILRRRSSQ